MWKSSRVASKLSMEEAIGRLLILRDKNTIRFVIIIRGGGGKKVYRNALY